MAANDGRNFGDLDQDTQDLFNNTYPGAGEQIWEQQANANLGSYSSSGDGSWNGVSGAGSGPYSDVNNSGSSSGSSSAPSAPRTTTVNGVSGVDPDDYMEYLRQISGFERDKLKQQMDLEKKKLDFQYAQMKQQAKTAAAQLAVDKWYKEQQVLLLNKNHDLDVQKYQFDVIKTVASMGGPGDYFQAADLALGIKNGQAGQGIPEFLQRLQNGQGIAAFQAPGGLGAPQSLASLGAQLGIAAPGTTTGVSAGEQQAQQQREAANQAALGQGASGDVSALAAVASGAAAGAADAVNPLTPPPAITNLFGNGAAGQTAGMGTNANSLNYDQTVRNQQALGVIGGQLQAGAHKLAPGAWESLGQDNQKLYLSGVKKLGGSGVSWLENYFNSRPNQGSTMAA